MDTCACAARSGEDDLLHRMDCTLAEQKETLAFSPLTLTDRDIIEPYIQVQGFENSELTFADMYIWRNSWRVEWAIAQNALYLRMRMPGKCLMYPVMPLDGKLSRAQLELAIESMSAQGLRPVMTSVDDAYMERVRAVLPHGWHAVELPDFADYIYRAEDLISLKGKRYHAKRNHIARFIRSYQGRYLYRPLEARDLGESLKLWDIWYSQRVDHMDEVQRLEAAYERDMIAQAIPALEPLGLHGGVVDVDGNMAAFTLGEMRHDTLLVRLEKALDKYDGIYAYINRQFAQHECQTTAWINREEDMGIPGLRRSKLSYCPHHMLRKYQICFDGVEADT